MCGLHTHFFNPPNKGENDEVYFSGRPVLPSLAYSRYC